MAKEMEERRQEMMRAKRTSQRRAKPADSDTLREKAKESEVAVASEASVTKSESGPTKSGDSQKESGESKG